MTPIFRFHCILTYHLVSNIRCTSNIRRTPTLGNSQLEFSPTISLAKTPNTRRTPSLTLECRLLTKCEVDPHGPSCSLWPEILTHRRSKDQWQLISLGPYARHIALIPAAKLCDSIAIVFLSIEVRIWHHLRRYLDRQRHFVYCQSTRIAR